MTTTAAAERIAELAPAHGGSLQLVTPGVSHESVSRIRPRLHARRFRVPKPFVPENIKFGVYTFVPWVRSGLSAALKSPAGGALRATVEASVMVRGDSGESAAAGNTLTLRGPGDVIGIDLRANHPARAAARCARRGGEFSRAHRVRPARAAVALFAVRAFWRSAPAVACARGLRCLRLRGGAGATWFSAAAPHSARRAPAARRCLGLGARAGARLGEGRAVRGGPALRQPRPGEPFAHPLPAPAGGRPQLHRRAGTHVQIRRKRREQNSRRRSRVRMGRDESRGRNRAAGLRLVAVFHGCRRRF